MEEGSDQNLLREIVLENSQSNIWYEARQEWQLISIYYEPDSRCICKHVITENCVIMNKFTKAELVVGNVCIEQFEDPKLSVGKEAMKSLRAIYLDPSHSRANSYLLDIAHRLTIIGSQDYKLYRQITKGPGAITRFNRNHRKFSLIDFIARRRINTQIKMAFNAKRPRCSTCNKFMLPRRRTDNKDRNDDTGYFYVCCNTFIWI